MSDVVSLTVNGDQYAGWKSVRIEAGVQRVARSFELSVTDHWPGNNQLRRIQPGDLCEVRIGDDLVCTGHVDATPVNYDASAITVMIRGRSKTGDLVDCSAEHQQAQYRANTVDAIARQLAAQYGIAVITEAAVGEPLADHQIQQGESAFESLDRLAKLRQILMTDNAAGDLVLASPGSGGTAASALALGVNVLSASAGFDYTEVYSDYTVKGQHSRMGNDEDWAANTSAHMSQSLGAAHDAGIKRRRVLLVRQSGQADANACQQRADYEQSVRAAKAGEIRYRVAGWRQADGSLWRPNQTVNVNDSIMRITADRLITEVVWSLDEGGMMTEMVVMPAAGLLTEPEYVALRQKRSGGNSTLASWDE